MTKRKSLAAKLQSTCDPRAGDSSPDPIASHLPSAAAIRETVESIVIAFVLAFLFRTFEAEAFVIPTGSMAPTLMGRHKDFPCPKCGCYYQVSASEEVTPDGAPKGPMYQVVSGTCPMCRYTAYLGRDNPQQESYPSYSGDRILVCKFAYELSEPQRWDVIVFKFPGDETTDARTNFIKRLVGLPGETVRLQHGDLWTRRDDEPFRIARKPPEKLLAMLQPVFDNSYMPRIAADGWPARWRPEPAADGSSVGGWSSDDSVTFHADGTAKGETWLRYRHLVPTYEQWRMRENLPESTPINVEPQLITDFSAYNTGRTQGAGDLAPDRDSLGLYWVGDLALKCRAEVESEQGALIFELRKGGRQFQCRIDVATGRATLSISGADMAQFQPTAATAVRGPGRHDIIFSNCDNELRLWIDGRVVAFDAPTTYGDLDNWLPKQSDYTPVGVASAGVKAKIDQLVIARDIYYIADLSHAKPQQFTGGSSNLFAADVEVGKFLRNRTEKYADFTLKADQFFALGDNSARSKDGRLWGSDNHWVPRELLIGKALFIYWPHSWNKIPYVHLPCPYFPNFSEMGLVR